MASIFNYRMMLGLDSSRFSKGLRQAEAQWARFQSTIMTMAGALGAGMGLGAIVSRLKDTAVDLSVAEATLKNTFMNGAENMKNYGDAVQFLQDVSKKYKQEIIALTESFAKFHAAADQMNVTYEDQKKVFEALTRAATYYHLSSERTRDVMVAVEQMFSKGKVTAEELRRQLGNNMPGAFGLMAKAAGVTTAQLEDMMKKGQVLADQVLPKFADELNKITKEMDMDSLQLAMNELSNAWTEFTKSSDFQKELVKWVNRGINALTRFRQNIKSVINDLIILGSVLSLRKGLQAIARLTTATTAYKNTIKQITTATTEWEKTVIHLKGGFKGLGPTFKNLFSSHGIYLCIMAVAELTAHIIQFSKATREANNTAKTLWENFYNERDRALLDGDRLEIKVSLKHSVDELKSLKEGTKEYGEAVKSIFAEMGEKDPLNPLKTGWDEVNSKVNEYIEHLNDSALMQVYSSQIANLTAEMKQAQRDMDNYKPGFWQSMWDSMVLNGRFAMKSSDTSLNSLIAAFGGKTGLENLSEREKQIKQTIDTMTKDMEEVYQRIDAWDKAHGTGKYSNTNKGGGSGIDEKDKLYKALKKYKEDSESLENRKNAGFYNGRMEEYAKAMEKINETAAESILSFKDWQEKAKSFGKEWENIANEVVSKFPASSMAKQVADDIDKYIKEEEERFEKQLQDDLEKEGRKIDKYFDMVNEDQPKPGARKRSLLDYKKDNSDIAAEQYKSWTKYEEELRKLVEEYRELDGYTEQASRQLEKWRQQALVAAATAEELRAAMDYAEIAEDIEEYQKQLLQLSAKGIKGMAQDLDRIVSGAKSIKDAFDDGTGWEQFMAIFNEIVQVIDTVTGIIKTIQAIGDVSEMLAGAELALEQAKSVEMGTQLALQEAITRATEKEAAAKVAASSAMAGILGQNTAAMAQETALALAAKEYAAAKAVANAMELPPPANIAALTENIAAAGAAFGAIKAFKSGGLVDYGSSSGDKTLARVNRGEGILTQKGVKNLHTLYGMVSNSQNMAGNVQFKIRGTDLIGAIENERSRRRG